MPTNIRKEDILSLQAAQGKLVLSLYFPLERIYPASGQNEIRLKNLLRAGGKQLGEYVDSTTVDILLEKARELAGTVDLLHPEGEGLALFAGEDGGKVLFLPYAPSESVTVDDHYKVRGLVHAMNGVPHYLLLTISRHDSHLYRGAGKSLKEIRTGGGVSPELASAPSTGLTEEEVRRKGFPFAFPETARTEPLRRHTRQDNDQEELEEDRILVRQIADILLPIVRDSKTPLFVLGEAEHLSYLKEHTPVGPYIAGDLAEHKNYAGSGGMLALIYPVIERFFENTKKNALAQLSELTGYGRSASGIQDVWMAVQKGQAMTVLVEENYSVPATIGNNSLELIIEDDAKTDTGLKDAVGEAITMALATDANVIFYPQGQLTQHNGIAAALRYAETAD